MIETKYTSKLKKEDIETFMHDYLNYKPFNCVHNDDDSWLVVFFKVNDELTLTDYDIKFDGEINSYVLLSEFILKSWRKFLNKKFETYKEDLKNYMLSQIDDVMAYLN